MADHAGQFGPTAVVDTRGRPIPDLPVSVTAAGVPAAVYADRDRTPLAGPLTTSAVGMLGFFAEPGRVTLTFIRGGVPYSYEVTVPPDPDDAVGAVGEHAATHHTGGGDPISLPGIGAAPEHDHPYDPVGTAAGLVDGEAQARVEADELLLPLTGGELTGPLTLPGDAVLPLHAATRAFVDTTVTEMVGERLAKAANLSDVASAAAARGNLGLGSAAVADRVAAGAAGVLDAQDPTTSNARPPTAHATTHAVGGTDLLSPAAIGAAPAHDHPYDPTGTAATRNSWYASLDPFLPTVSTGGWVPTVDTAAIGNGKMDSPSGAPGPELGWDVALSAGTWRLEWLHVTGLNRGVYSVRLNGVEVGSVTGYAAVAARNVAASVQFEVATTAKHRVAFVMAGQGAGGGYAGSVQRVVLRRTA